MKNYMSQSKSTTSELQKTTDQLKMKHRLEVEKLQNELIDAREGSAQTIQDLETQLLEKSEEIKSIKLMTQKQEAIWAQKNEFNEVQFVQTKKALDEQKKQNENLMSVISEKQNNVTSGKEAIQKEIENLKLTHQAEISNLENELHNLQGEIEIVKSSYEEKLAEAECKA
jgi:hypothetical protein